MHMIIFYFRRGHRYPLDSPISRRFIPFQTEYASFIFSYLPGSCGFPIFRQHSISVSFTPALLDRTISVLHFCPLSSSEHSTYKPSSALFLIVCVVFVDIYSAMSLLCITDKYTLPSTYIYTRRIPIRVYDKYIHILSCTEATGYCTICNTLFTGVRPRLASAITLKGK